MLKFSATLAAALLIATAALGADDGCKSDWKKCDANGLTSTWEKRNEVRTNCEMRLKKISRFGDPELSFLPFSTVMFSPKLKADGKAIFIEREARLPNGFGAKEKLTIGCMVKLDTLAIEDIGPINLN